MVRDGLSVFLNSHENIEVVGEAEDGREAVRLVNELAPDVVLMDLVMPNMDGMEAMNEIHETQPQTQVIVLTSFVDDDRVVEAVQGGAAGFLLKDVNPDELATAIEDVAGGEPHLHPDITKRMMRQLAEPQEPDQGLIEDLTPRELDVLEEMAHGLRNREIAEELFISEKTVKTHVSNILDKLDVNDRTQAVVYALKHKLVDLDEI
jgi:DNA-binding NarL/FixJ family response regulator